MEDLGCVSVKGKDTPPLRSPQCSTSDFHVHRKGKKVCLWSWSSFFFWLSAAMEGSTVGGNCKGIASCSQEELWYVVFRLWETLMQIYLLILAWSAVQALLLNYVIIEHSNKMLPFLDNIHPGHNSSSTGTFPWAEQAGSRENSKWEALAVWEGAWRRDCHH